MAVFQFWNIRPCSSFLSFFVSLYKYIDTKYGTSNPPKGNPTVIIVESVSPCSPFLLKPQNPQRKRIFCVCSTLVFVYCRCWGFCAPGPVRLGPWVDSIQ